MCSRTVKEQNYIEACEQFVKGSLAEAESGHNFQHIERVRKMARYLQSKEGGNAFVIEMAALLHDISDAKFNGGNESLGAQKSREFLLELGLKNAEVEEIAYLVEHCSYKGGRGKKADNLELQILQDADRLDAIGAVGIARTFHYGGYKNAVIYDPDQKPKKEQSLAEYRKERGTTINHFYEKLLQLKNGMHTRSAKKIAEQRHQFMLTFLDQFYQEWEGPSLNSD